MILPCKQFAHKSQSLTLFNTPNQIPSHRKETNVQYHSINFIVLRRHSRTMSHKNMLVLILWRHTIDLTKEEKKEGKSENSAQQQPKTTSYQWLR